MATSINWDMLKETHDRLKSSSGIPSESFKQTYIGDFKTQPYRSEGTWEMYGYTSKTTSSVPKYIVPELLKPYPRRIIVDDPQSEQKENQMIFKFTTEKPSAVNIWNTINELIIVPNAGYTDFQIKYMMFCILQLSDFKLSKDIINRYLSKNSIPLNDLIVVFNGTIINKSDLLTHAQLPPQCLPQFVEEDLYIPYYITMQLDIEASSGIWTSLFDRGHITSDRGYIIANNSSINYHITPYKLWKSGYDIITDKYSDIFTIDMSLAPIDVQSKSEMIQVLYNRIDSYFLDNHIYTYDNKLSIAPFKLVVPSPPSSS